MDRSPWTRLGRLMHFLLRESRVGGAGRGVSQAEFPGVSLPCARLGRPLRACALSSRGTHRAVFTKTENSDRIYNVEFKIWGVGKENLTL